jgi:hypothetical protein
MLNIGTNEIEHMLPHFFDQLFASNEGGAGIPMWQRGRGGGPKSKRRGVVGPRDEWRPIGVGPPTMLTGPN